MKINKKTGRYFRANPEDHKWFEGKTFHYWTVLKYEYHDKGKAVFLCRCKCGTERKVLARNLCNSRSKSCGCWRKEKLKLRHLEGAKS